MMFNFLDFFGIFREIYKRCYSKEEFIVLVGGFLKSLLKSLVIF